MWRRVVEGIVVSSTVAAAVAGVKAADDTMRRAAGRTARTCIYLFIYRCVYAEKREREREYGRRKKNQNEKKKPSVWHSQVIRTPRGPPAREPVTHQRLFYTHIIQGVLGRACHIYRNRRRKSTRRTPFRETLCGCATSVYNNSVDHARVPDERVFNEPFWRNVRCRVAVASKWSRVKHTMHTVLTGKIRLIPSSVPYNGGQLKEERPRDTFFVASSCHRNATITYWRGREQKAQLYFSRAIVRFHEKVTAVIEPNSHQRRVVCLMLNSDNRIPSKNSRS